MRSKILATCALLVFGAVIVVSADWSIDRGQLLASYATQDGGAIVVTSRATDRHSQLVVFYVDANDNKDTLHQIDLSDELGRLEHEVCGGRLHLTYEAGGEVYHDTVDVPSATLLFLPTVCKDDNQ